VIETFEVSCADCGNDAGAKEYSFNLPGIRVSFFIVRCQVCGTKDTGLEVNDKMVWFKTEKERR